VLNQNRVEKDRVKTELGVYIYSCDQYNRVTKNMKKHIKFLENHCTELD